MSEFLNVDIAFLGSSSVDATTGVVLWEPSVPVIDSDADIEPFGPAAVYQALGFASMPFPKDANGYAECVILRHCGGRNVVCLGGRDTRTASIVGKMEGGDTVVHSTGPAQAAQLQLKETKRIAALLSKTSSGKTMMLALDGGNEKAQLTHAGAIVEIDDNGDISVLNSSGAGLLVQGGNVHIIGNPVLGAGNPSGFGFALVPLTGSPGGPASTPLLCAQGVTPGS